MAIGQRSLFVLRFICEKDRFRKNLPTSPQETACGSGFPKKQEVSYEFATHHLFGHLRFDMRWIYDQCMEPGHCCHDFSCGTVPNRLSESKGCNLLLCKQQCYHDRSYECCCCRL